MECNYAQIEKNFTDYIINLIGPNREQDQYRANKLEIIKSIIQNGFAYEQDIIPHVFSFGSFPLRTYLRDSDMDITLILEKKSTGKIISNYSSEYLSNILLRIENSLQNYNKEIGMNQIADIQRIEADVRLIKCKFDNLSFDISINNFVGLCKLIFMHHLELNAFDGVFFKRTLFLIKSWSYYEGSILGSNVGLMASYALEVLVIYMFNNYSHLFANEIEAFFTFFKLMSQIDWEKKIVTIFGQITESTFYEKLQSFDMNLDMLLMELIDNTLEQDSNQLTPKPLIKLEDISNFHKQFEKFADLDKVQNFHINKRVIITNKHMNIIDPLFNANNLGKSVNLHNYSKISKIFEYTYYNDCNSLIKSKISFAMSSSEYLNSLLKLFQKTVIGCNPELFRLNLPEPKIIVIPSQGAKGQEMVTRKQTQEVDTGNCASPFDKLLTAFNQKFSLGELVEQVSCSSQDTMPIANPISNYLWPTNEQISDEQTLYSYYNLNIKEVSYLTHEILEFIMNSTDNKTEDAYQFQTANEISEIEEFIQNSNIGN